jgi:predicted Zn-dependent protease
MKTTLIKPLTVLFCVLAANSAAHPAPAEPAKEDLLLKTMQQELTRAQKELRKLDPAPYYIGYSVHDENAETVVGSLGSVITSGHFRRRAVDVIMRVGTPELDNAHGENRGSAITTGTLPLEDDPDAIAHVLWQLTFTEYRKAQQAYLNVKTKTQVNAAEEDTSADFSKETPQTHAEYQQLAPLAEQPRLEKMVRLYSADLKPYPYVYSSITLLSSQTTRSYFVSTEGAKLVTPGAVVRMMIEGRTRADDGMELMRVETFQDQSLDRLPPGTEIAKRVEKMASDLKALRLAPVADPFDGPALLSGRSSAVFFHEVLGHRLEGHRQRGEQEGQTFTKKLNEKILPEFLTVTDDPTRHSLGGIDLSGWYEFDDEGVAAKPVEVIKDGVLKSFLMSRMPIKNFSNSNGHGRAQPGLMPTGRQGNLIVTSSRTVPDSEMRQKLLEEIKKQGKPFGLYFEDIEGGFTLTQREAPQAFEVLPIMVWRVYADGRPDELVRGVDIVGTPLSAMTRILLTGDKESVFNGICGAESGSLPVSAVAPSILFSEIEVQKRKHSLERPPILPPPGFENVETAGGRQ